MSDSIRLCSVTLECPDAGKLAQFYAQITGGTVILHDEERSRLTGCTGVVTA